MRRRWPGPAFVAARFKSTFPLLDGFQSESSQASSSPLRFQRGGLPGLEEAPTFSSALRLVSRFARAYRLVVSRLT